MKRTTESISRRALPYLAVLAAGSAALTGCSLQGSPEEKSKPVPEAEVAKFAELYGTAIDSVKVSKKERQVIREQSAIKGEVGGGGGQPGPSPNNQGKSVGKGAGQPKPSNVGESTAKGGGQPRPPAPSGAPNSTGEEPQPDNLVMTYKEIPASDGKSGYDLSVTREVNETSQKPGPVTEITISSYVKDGDVTKTVYSGSLYDEDAKLGGADSDSWSVSTLYNPTATTTNDGEGSLGHFYSQGAEDVFAAPPKLTAARLGALTRDMTQVLFAAEHRQPVTPIDPPGFVAEQP